MLSGLTKHGECRTLKKKCWLEEKVEELQLSMPETLRGEFLTGSIYLNQKDFGISLRNASPKFLMWFEKCLLKNIPSNSVIIVDNAPYHSVIKDKAPTTASEKEEMGV